VIETFVQSACLHVALSKGIIDVPEKKAHENSAMKQVEADGKEFILCALRTIWSLGFAQCLSTLCRFLARLGPVPLTGATTGRVRRIRRRRNECSLDQEHEIRFTKILAAGVYGYGGSAADFHRADDELGVELSCSGQLDKRRFCVQRSGDIQLAAVPLDIDTGIIRPILVEKHAGEWIVGTSSVRCKSYLASIDRGGSPPRVDVEHHTAARHSGAIVDTQHSALNDVNTRVERSGCSISHGD
jgi:hypothetical protein